MPRFVPSAPRIAVEALGSGALLRQPRRGCHRGESSPGISATDCKAFKSDFGGILSDGQGEMKGQLFRIAHIGYLDYLDCIAVIAGLEHVLMRLGDRNFELGDGLRAAQTRGSLLAGYSKRPGAHDESCGCREDCERGVEAVSRSAIRSHRSEEFARGDPAAALQDADALIVRSAVQADEKLIANAKSLKVIGRAGVGVDNVDVEFATRRGIVVMNAPGASSMAVAELRLA